MRIELGAFMHLNSVIYICIDSATLRFEAIETPTPQQFSGNFAFPNLAPLIEHLRFEVVDHV